MNFLTKFSAGHKPLILFKQAAVLQQRKISTNVYISTCHNIFYNLAFEEWIYSNVDFSERQLLILWRNEPCIVIGRHQNPWVECSIHNALQRGIQIARRQSGGGTVYHDKGNLNCTFFTHKKKYKRKDNLELVAKALKKQWGFDVSVSERDDLKLEGKYKISGTAAKLGSKVAYHHFTLLFDVDKNQLGSALHSDLKGVSSKATESIRATIKNLCELDPSLTYNSLVEVIGKEYLQQYSDPSLSQAVADYVDPTRENIFPGIHNMCASLKSWDWIYGKTPKFNVNRTFEAENDLDPITGLDVQLEVNKGRLTEITLRILGGGGNRDVDQLCGRITDVLLGQRFWASDIASALHGLSSEVEPCSDAVYKWICECIDDIFE